MVTLRSTWRSDALVAALLAAVLGAVWTARDWANLSVLRLPDTDDVVRLQQVRDWLAGQRWADLTQYRLGAGVPMHWSRLGDLGPAAGISALTPTIGRHAAEIASVIGWPLVLFAVALFLVARVARRLGDDLGGTAAVIAAISYPATTLFLPGRIDHHGLQMVLLLGAMLALVRPQGGGAGFAAGLCAAASLVIGLETAPLLGVLGAAAVLSWIADARCGRLPGLGVGALLGLVLGRGMFMTTGWDYPACDGFTDQAWRAAFALAFVPVVLAFVSPYLLSRRARAVAAALVGSVAIGVALWLSPGCAAPYGEVDPALAKLWLSRVAEAQPLLGAPVATAIGYAGLLIAGIAATGWRLRVERSSGWATLLALQLAAFAVTLVQLRVAYAGALLAAPGLAAAVRAARARGVLPLASAWAASAGVLYPLAADAMIRDSQPVSPGNDLADCASPALLARLAALPPGTVAAPVDLGAWGLAATPHRYLAAPYHRDGVGILAADRFFRAAPSEAARLAARWHLTYAVTCTDAPPASMAAQLASGRASGWHRVAADGGAAIWMRDPASSRSLFASIVPR